MKTPIQRFGGKLLRQANRETGMMAYGWMYEDISCLASSIGYNAMG